MKILPVIQNFLPRADALRNNFFNNSSFLGISFLGATSLTPLQEDTLDFEHKPMSGNEFKKYGRYMTDLYTGEKMLTSDQLNKMKTRGFFNGPICKVVKNLKPYAKDYLSGTELDVFEQIEQAAKRDPDFTLPQLFNFWYIDTRTEFRKEQKPYFDKIKELGAQLPPEYIEKFYNFMALTDKKLYDVPIKQKFSLKEFNYNITKITDRIVDNGLRNRMLHLLKMLNDETMLDNSVPVSSKIVKEAFDFKNKKTPNKKSVYYDHFLKHYEWDKDAVRIQIIENMQEAAAFKGYKRLERLCKANVQMLRGKPVIVPFSNKAFCYDLGKILHDLPDEHLRDEILSVARKLPSSNNSAEALILKYKDSDADTIGDRLFNPSLVSVEHLHPQSEGGSDLMINCALCRRKYNYERMSEPLSETFKRYERRNQQKYVDSLIKLANKGILAYSDVLGQIHTIENEGNIKLDYSKLVERPLTLKEEQIVKYKKIRESNKI